MFNILLSLAVSETWRTHSQHQRESSSKDAEITEFVEPVFSPRTMSTFSGLFSISFLNSVFWNKHMCTQWWLLPKAVSLPPPFLVTEKWVLEFSKRCIMENNQRCFFLLPDSQDAQLSACSASTCSHYWLWATDSTQAHTNLRTAQLPLPLLICTVDTVHIPLLFTLSKSLLSILFIYSSYCSC